MSTPRGVRRLIEHRVAAMRRAGRSCPQTLVRIAREMAGSPITDAELLRLVEDAWTNTPKETP